MRDGERFELAEIITELYHGKEAVHAAKLFFETAFQRRAIPENIPSILIEIGEETIAHVIPQLTAQGMVQS